MPVFDRRNQKASGSLTDDLMELIQDIRRQLRKFHNIDTNWIKEYLEDKETDLMLDHTVSEYEEIRDNLETLQERLEEIEDDYDLEDEDESADAQDDLGDLGDLESDLDL